MILLKITISLASPESILERSHGEVLNLKPLIIEHTNQKEMVCFVKEFLVQLKIMNVIVVNTRELDIKVSFVIDVE